MSLFSSLFGKKKTEGISMHDSYKSIKRPTISFKTHNCPYCDALLSPIPQRKKKCQKCSNFVFVRTSLDSNNKILVTDIEAKKIDEFWEKVNFRDRWLNNIESYGITKEKFFQLKIELSKAAGFERTDGDVFWSAFNTLLLQNAHSHSDLSTIYYSMALLLNEEGKESFNLQQESRKHYLLDIKNAELSLNVSILSLSGCESCKNQDGLVFTIQEALEKMPIPHKECSFTFSENGKPFCRCCFGAVRID